MSILNRFLWGVKNKMENKEIIQNAKELINKYNVFDKLAEHGKPMFLMVSGAHNFGFPSPDSDYDIRGVYQAPTESILGLNKVQPTTFEYESEDKKLDVSIDEVGHYLRVLSNSNGNRLEWPSSKLIFYKSPNFGSLKEVVDNNVVSKALVNHYLNFARDMWSGKTKAEGVKKDLYTLRVYMSGINIFENKDINPNIIELNKKFKEPIISPMIRAKERGEWSDSNGYDRKELENLVNELDSRLIKSVENSNLSENPNIFAIDKYLKDLRVEDLL